MSKYLMRPRTTEPSPNPDRVRENHSYYKLFLEQGSITPDMQFIAYQLENGQAQFVTGAPTIDKLVLLLEGKLGIPRKTCRYMNLANHRNYKPE